MQRYYTLTIDPGKNVILHSSIDYLYYFRNDNTTRTIQILRDVLATTECISGKENYYAEWIENVNKFIEHLTKYGMREHGIGTIAHIVLLAHCFPEECEWDD